MNLRSDPKEFSITVPVIEKEALRALALNWSRLQGRDLARIPNRSTYRSAVDLACINYLRHHATNYDRLVTRYNSFDLSDAILMAIAEGYPWLAKECRHRLGRNERRLRRDHPQSRSRVFVAAGREVSR